MKKTNSKIYKANVGGGSLLIRESRILARLMLENLDNSNNFDNFSNSQAWYQAIVIDNILQKRSPATARLQARLIKNRLTLMKPEFLELIDKGASDVVVQALLAASIKHSRLLGDFMTKVIKSHWQLFNKCVSARDWQEYLETCSQIDSNIQSWTDGTRSKLKQIIFRILVEAKYVNNIKSLELLPVNITPEVKIYLINNSEDYILKCMEITP